MNTEIIPTRTLLASWLIASALGHQWARAFAAEQFAIVPNSMGSSLVFTPTEEQRQYLRYNRSTEQYEVTAEGISAVTLGLTTPGACGYGITCPCVANDKGDTAGSTGSGRISWSVWGGGDAIQLQVLRPTGRIANIVLRAPESTASGEYIYTLDTMETGDIYGQGNFYHRHGRAVIDLINGMVSSAPSLVDVGVSTELRGGYLTPAGDGYDTDYEWLLQSSVLPDYGPEEEAEIKARFEQELAALLKKRAELAAYRKAQTLAPNLGAGWHEERLAEATSPEAMDRIINS
jgi:hypothetical protein